MGVTKKKLSEIRGNIKFVVFGKILSCMGAFIGVRLLTELVAKDVFGEFKLIISWASLVMGFCILPFIQFTMREYHDARQEGYENEFLIYIWSIYAKYILIIAAALALVVTLYTTYINSLYILLVFCFTAIVAYERSVFVTKNMQLAAVIITNYEKWIPPAVIALLIFLFEGTLFTVMVGFIAPMLVISIYFVWRNTNHIEHNKNSIFDSKTIFKKAVLYGWPIAIVGLLSWVVNESDRVILDIYLNSEEVGVYAAAYGLISAPFVVVSGAIAQVAYPIIFREAASKKKIERTARRLIFLNIFICILGVLFVIFFGKYVAEIGLASEYRESARELFIWIAIAYGFYSVAIACDLRAYAMGNTKDLLIAYGVAAPINLVGNIIMIPELGTEGAAISTAISMLFYLLVMYILSKRNLKQCTV